MKQFNIYLSFLLALVVLMSCGGGDGGGNGSSAPTGTPPVTYTQEISVAATGGEQILTLSNLKSSITTIDNNSPWLVVSPQFYTSGSPQIKLNATANTSPSERSCKVTITAVSGEKVVLTVTQRGNSAGGTGIEDLHDSQTDQPAYAPMY